MRQRTRDGSTVSPGAIGAAGGDYPASSFMARASAVSRSVIPPDSWVVRSTRTVR